MGEMTGAMRELTPRVHALEQEMRSTRQQISDHAHLVAKIEGLESKLDILQKAEATKISFWDGIKTGGKSVIIAMVVVVVLAARGFVETCEVIFEWIVNK